MHVAKNRDMNQGRRQGCCYGGNPHRTYSNQVFTTESKESKDAHSAHARLVSLFLGNQFCPEFGLRLLKYLKYQGFLAGEGTN